MHAIGSDASRLADIDVGQIKHSFYVHKGVGSIRYVVAVWVFRAYSQLVQFSAIGTRGHGVVDRSDRYPVPPLDGSFNQDMIADLCQNIACRFLRRV